MLYKNSQLLPEEYKCAFCGNHEVVCHYSPGWDGDRYEDWAIYTCVRCGAHFFEDWWGTEDTHWTSKSWKTTIYFKSTVNIHGAIYWEYYQDDPERGKRIRRIKAIEPVSR